MRPGQQAPESEFPVIEYDVEIHRFNEARAASPGILLHQSLIPALDLGFNEARAASPGIRQFSRRSFIDSLSLQ